MSTFKLPQTAFALVLTAAALPMADAQAADLDPGYADVPAPITQQMVTFGSGWYVRGDMGVTKDYELDVVQPRKSTVVETGIKQGSKAGYDLSVGGGYSFTNNVRGDVNVDFHQPLSAKNFGSYCFNSVKQTCTSNGDFGSYDALANAYYDFAAWGVVTPYVGGGLGVAFGQLKTHLTPNYVSDYRYHNIAWALMAGVAIDVYAHTKLDVGYRYLDNGHVYGTHLFYHEIRAGLRYMIDN